MGSRFISEELGQTDNYADETWSLNPEPRTSLKPETRNQFQTKNWFKPNCSDSFETGLKPV
jgi:hypothetical protein